MDATKGVAFTALSDDTVAIVTLEMDDAGELEVAYQEMTDVAPPSRFQVVKSLRVLADAIEDESDLAGD